MSSTKKAKKQNTSKRARANKDQNKSKNVPKYEKKKQIEKRETITKQKSQLRGCNFKGKLTRTQMLNISIYVRKYKERT